MSLLRNMIAANSNADADQDPYWANVVSLLHFDGTDGSTTFTDQTGKTWTGTTGIAIDTDQSRFGGASLYVPGGNGDVITTPSSADFDFSSMADYTIELFFRPVGDQNGSALVTTARNASGAVHFALGFCNGTLGSSTGNLPFFGFYTGSAWVGIAAPSALADSSWSHIAATREGNVYRLFINGVQQASTTSATANPTQNAAILIGRRWELSLNKRVAGHIDELRITKGVARYTTNFTPPTAAFSDG